MKKLSVILVVLLFGASTMLNAGEPFVFAVDGWGQEDVEIDIDLSDLEQLKQLKNLNKDQIKKIQISMSGEYGVDTPLLGVYLADMTFQEAYEMHYDYNYGVLLSGTVPGGGAQQAGLMKGDIIMEFGGQKARYEGQLSTMIKSKKAGEAVDIVFFRNEQVYETRAVLQSRQKPKIDETTGEIIVTKKHKLDVGGGGGSWIPMWFVDKNKFEDVNKVIKDFGFTPLREDGMFLNGFGGKGNIGKNWFLGGIGEWYSIDRKKMTDTGERRMKYGLGFGGVTLDKRIMLSRNLATSLGFMLGWGGQTLELSNIGNNYDWDSLSVQVVNPNTNNNYVKLEKNYILLQPKFEMIYRLTDWLGIRAAVGYMLSYSYHSGWNANICDDIFEVTNSPETKLDGLTISVGPWFGF